MKWVPLRSPGHPPRWLGRVPCDLAPAVLTLQRSQPHSSYPSSDDRGQTSTGQETRRASWRKGYCESTEAAEALLRCDLGSLPPPPPGQPLPYWAGVLETRGVGCVCYLGPEGRLSGPQSHHVGVCSPVAPLPCGLDQLPDAPCPPRTGCWTAGQGSPSTPCPVNRLVAPPPPGYGGGRRADSPELCAASCPALQGCLDLVASGSELFHRPCVPWVSRASVTLKPSTPGRKRVHSLCWSESEGPPKCPQSRCPVPLCPG